MTDAITQQLSFLIEADKLKSVTRANVLMDGSRAENTAEHSWHLALWALIMADTAPSGTDIDRALAMALLHDLEEIDAGDHPIHLPQDLHAIAQKEKAAADRIFALLPDEQGQSFRTLWEEFEAGETPTARYLRQLDMTQPLYQALGNVTITDTDRDIIRDILTTGRSAALADDWPEVYVHATGLLNGDAPQISDPLKSRLRFLAEADLLKTTLRATTLHDGSRAENSAEHSWHIALYALTLSAHTDLNIDPGRVIRMLILHDLVEIDAGDAPIHGNHDAVAMAAAESAAAERLFGMLPPAQGVQMRALWEEFEAAETADAIFGKSIDRVQPVISNLQSGGASWIDYNVSRAQVEARVAGKVKRGAPAVWAAIKPRIDTWFAAQ